MSLVSRDRLWKAVSEIYEPIGDADAWLRILRILHELLPADLVNVVGEDASRDEVVTLASVGDQAGELLSRYEKELYARDPWMKPGRVLPLGSAIPSEAFVPLEVLERTDFYHEVMRPVALKHGCGATLIREENGLILRVTAVRGPDRGPFGDDELALLQRLVPHLSNALALVYRFEALKADATAAADLLERLPVATLLIGAGGRVLRTNPAADSILSRGDCLRISRGRLVACSPRADRRFHRLLSECLASARGNDTPAPGTLLLPRTSDDDMPLEIVALPLPTESGRWGSWFARVALLVRDRDLRPRTHPDWLRALYGLTPAEAALAVAVGQAESLREFAERVGISEQTARTQLKSVFAKTGVRRQAELVALLLTGPTSLSSRTR